MGQKDNKMQGVVLIVAALLLNIWTALYGVDRYGGSANLFLLSLAGNLIIFFFLYRLRFSRQAVRIGRLDQAGAGEEKLSSINDPLPFQWLVDDLPEAVLILQEDRPYYVNRALLELLEIDPEELDENNFAYSRIISRIRHARHKSETELCEVGPFRTVSGQSNVLHLKARVVPLTKNRDDLVAVLFADVSVQQKQEKQQREMELEVLRQTRLTALGNSTMALVYNLAEPLTRILGLSEVGALTDTGDKRFANIVDEAGQMAKIIDDLVHKGRSDYHNEPGELSLNELITQELDLLTKNVRTFSEMEADIILDDKLPQIQGVASDFSLPISAILTNALEAMEFSKKKVLRIQTRFNEQAIFIEISDTGCGVGKRELGRLFEPYYTTKQDHEDDDDQAVHHGLGLSTSRFLLSRYDGRIGVLSTPGAGSTFSIRIPLVDEATDEVSKQPTETAETNYSGVYAY